MGKEGICPEIRYRKVNAGIMITACFGNGGEVHLPDEIEEMPVTSIAPYAFAESELSEGDSIWLSDEAYMMPERKRMASSEITELSLPAGITEIGRYAFYRCRNLKKLVLSDGILEIGGGALTGCRISELEIHCRNGEKSALKSIVDEIRFEICVKIYYYKDEEKAEILFPEHYEEAVENTPARILYTSHHGAGGYYRQCFYNRELDYKKYDRSFIRAVAEESEETVLRLAVRRLQFPYKLSDEARNVYEEYVREHAHKAVAYYIEKEEMQRLRFLIQRQYVTRSSLEQGIDLAGQLGKTEMLSFLMDESKKYFPKKKKMFEL